MKLFILMALSLTSLSAFAKDSCYMVSKYENTWSRTPELLCISPMESENGKYEIKLKTGLAMDLKTLATFNFSLVSAVRCMDCNENVYGIANPENSVFNDVLSIRFNGKRNVETGHESGTVQIGESKLFYKNGL